MTPLTSFFSGFSSFLSAKLSAAFYSGFSSVAFSAGFSSVAAFTTLAGLAPSFDVVEFDVLLVPFRAVLLTNSPQLHAT